VCARQLTAHAQAANAFIVFCVAEGHHHDHIVYSNKRARVRAAIMGCTHSLTLSTY
jgi:hypothetical protein